MPVKIRLQRRGRKKQPFYHIVIADARAPRDGRFIEKIGIYNPMTKPATIDLDRDKAFEWLMNGAQPTDTARAILRFKGVMFRKHLMRGVSKGAMSQEQADVKYQEWIDEKEARIAERRQKALDEIEAFHKAMSGKAPKVEVAAAGATAKAGGPAREKEEAKSFAESVEQTTVESFSGAEPAETEEAKPKTKQPEAKTADAEEAVVVEETAVVEDTVAEEETAVVEETAPEAESPEAEESKEEATEEEEDSK